MAGVAIALWAAVRYTRENTDTDPKRLPGRRFRSFGGFDVEP